MHDDSFLPWVLYGNSACIVVPLPQRFREHSWLLPQLFPRSALAWKTRSASIDTNETSKELLVFSHNHRKKSCSTARQIPLSLIVLNFCYNSCIMRKSC